MRAICFTSWLQSKALTDYHTANVSLLRAAVLHAKPNVKVSRWCPRALSESEAPPGHRDIVCSSMRGGGTEGGPC